MADSIRQLTIYLGDEPEGFSASICELPGCASQGDTEEQATMNVIEALHALLECYADDKTPVPWVEANVTTGGGA